MTSKKENTVNDDFDSVTLIWFNKSNLINNNEMQLDPDKNEKCSIN